MDEIEYVTSSSEFAQLWALVRRRLGVSEEEMSVLKVEFARALSVKALDESGGLPPLLDAVWHEVVLNTRYYSAICQRLRGTFVHHSTASEVDDDIVRFSHVDKTVIDYRKRFRCEPPSKAWHNDNEAVIEVTRCPLSTLYVKGINGSVTTCTGLSPLTTVAQLKAMVQRKTGIHVDQQRLIFAGVQLEDKQTCANVGMEHDSTIYLVERVRGC